jgi:hypothetical protein
MHWINIEHMWVVTTPVMNLRVPLKPECFLIIWATTSFSRGLLHGFNYQDEVYVDYSQMGEKLIWLNWFGPRSDPSLAESIVVICIWINRVTLPVTVAARSKAWTVFARSNAAIVGSNPTWGMDVCVRLFCVCVVLCVGCGLATVWSPVQGVLPTLYKIKKLKKRPRPNKGL